MTRRTVLCRKVITIFCCISLVVGTVYITAGIQNIVKAESDKNLVTNGNAETDGTTGWSWTQGKVLTAYSNSDDKAQSTSHKSGNVGGEKYFDSWGYNSITQTITLEANTDYIFSMDYYALNGNASVTVNDGVSDLMNIPSSVSTKSWLKAGGTFTTGENTSITLKIYSGWSQYFFDNVTIIKDEAPQIVKNGDGEAGNTKGWTCTPDKIVKTVSSETDTSVQAKAHKDNNIGGKYYFDSWGYNSITQTITLEANTDYTFSMDYYALNGNASVTVNDGASDLMNIPSSVSTKSWLKANGTFTTGENTSITLKIYSGWSQYFFDNVSIIKDEAPQIVKNGDVEAGNTKGWTCTPDKIVKAVSSETDTSVQAKAHKDNNIGGKYYFDSWGYNSITQTIALEANTDYIFSMDYYALNGNASVTLNDDSTTLMNIPSSTSLNSWVKAKGTFTTGDNGSVTLKIYSGWSQYFFDNVSIIKDESDIGDTSIVKNGAAEKGNTKNWTCKPDKSVTAVEAAKSTTDAAKAHVAGQFGENYYFNSWSYNSVCQTVTLEPNKSYEFKMCYYAKKGNASVKISDGTDELMNVPTTSLNTWTNVDYVFTTKEISSILIQIDTGWDEYCFDNVQIIETTYATEPVEFKDGDFESGTFAPQGAYGGWNTGTSTYINKNKPQNGDYSLWIQWNWNSASQIFKVEPNTEYKFKFSYCAGDQSGMFVYKFLNVEDASVYAERTLGTSKSWSTAEVTFTTGDYTVLKLFLTSTLDTYVDDISFTEVPTYTEKDPEAPYITTFGSEKFYLSDGGTNLFEGGDFETEPQGSWNVDEFIGKDALSISDEESRSGSKSLKFESNGETEQSGIMWVDVTPNTDYIIQMSLYGKYMSEENLADTVVELINDKTNKALKTGTSSVSGIVPTRWDQEWHRRSVAFNSGYSTKIGILIKGKCSVCYIDDIVLCSIIDANTEPSTKDREDDSKLKLHNNASLVDYSTDIVNCDKDKNLLSDFDFAGKDSSYWDCYLNNKAFSLSTDYKDTSNAILKYDSSTPRYNNFIKWVEIEKNTQYAAYVRIRGDREGDGAFTVVTGAKFPIRLTKYTPERWDGVWQTYSIKFDSADEEKIGFAFIDGGGALSIDDVVLCNVKDATFSEAPELPPLPGSGTNSDDSNSDGSNTTLNDTTDTTGDYGSNNSFDTNNTTNENSTQSHKKVIKKPGTKDKTTYYEYEVTDWVTIWIIVGSVSVAVIAGGIILFVLIRKKKNKKKLTVKPKAKPEDSTNGGTKDAE